MDRWGAAVYIAAAIFVITVISYAESLRGSNPVNISVTQPTVTLNQTVTVTTTQTLNLTSSLSGEKALYGVIYNVGFITDGGQWTVIYLMTPDAEGIASCCDIYVFDGFVQGVPLGAKVMIVYEEFYVESWFPYLKRDRHLIVTEIQRIE